MKTLHQALLTSFLGFTFSATLHAEAPPPPPENTTTKTTAAPGKADGRLAGGGLHDTAEIFRKMDANNDGKISREEYAKASEERFAKFDGNKDGLLEKADVPEKLRERMAGKSRLPKDGNGGDMKITKEKFLQMSAKRFEKMDTNNDGLIDKTEFEALASKLHDHQGKAASGEPRKRPQ